MIHKRLTASFALLLFFSIALRGDALPEAGYKKVYLDIVLEPQEDFSDYRFFVTSGNLAREVFVKKGEQAVAGSLGGGALYSSGTILAVPKKSLAMFGENPAGEKLSALQTAVAERRAAGIIKLVDHQFAREVREAEASRLQDPVYRLERVPGGGVTAVQIESTNKTVSKTEQRTSDDPKSSGGLGWTTIVGGALISLAIVMVGFRLFRRSGNAG